MRDRYGSRLPSAHLLGAECPAASMASFQNDHKRERQGPDSHLHSLLMLKARSTEREIDTWLKDTV
jgi:hypothetical protein